MKKLSLLVITVIIVSMSSCYRAHICDTYTQYNDVESEKIITGNNM